MRTSGGDLDREVAKLARRQEGAFGWHQVEALGATRRMANGRVETGRWVRLGHNVFAEPSHPHSWRQRYAAALLGHPDGALRGLAVAHVVGLDGFGPVRPVPLTVPSGSRPRSDLAICRRSLLLRPRIVDGFRANATAIAMLEIAADAPALLERAYQAAILRNRTTFDAVSEVAVRASAARAKGARELRRLLLRLGAGHVPPESELERLLFEVLDRGGVVAYVRQAPCPWAPTGAQRVDVYIPAWRMIVEVDGRLWHARIASLDADRERDRLARHHGVLVERFGWTEVRDGPDECMRSMLTTAASFDRTI